jgi:hypothetical protein
MANVRLRQERPFRKPPAANEICAFKPAENDPVEADPLVWVAMERPLKALRQMAIRSRCLILSGRPLIKSPSPARLHKVSAPTFNASVTRACVTSLATLKSDSWASTRSLSDKELNAPVSTGHLGVS